MKTPSSQPKSRTKQSFLHGALILTVGVLIVKLIGGMFKVPLTWVIQEEGLGYFNTAYNFYSPIFSLATAGFPIAIARMVSENYARHRYRDIRQIHRASVPIFIITGSVGLLVMLIGAPFYVRAIGNEGALPAMYFLAPAILFSCLTAIYRGYYEGLSNMYPTAVSEIIEAICKLAIGLSGAYAVVKLGMNEFYTAGTIFGQPMVSEAYAQSAVLPAAAAAAIGGVTVGSLFGYLFLLIRHKRRGDGITSQELQEAPESGSFRETVVCLIKTAIPIGIGALAVNVAGLVDTTFLQTRIRDVMAASPDILLGMYDGMIPQVNIEAGTVPNFLYGCYSQALTLFMLVPAITQAFGISALPSVTAAWTGGNQKELKNSMESVLRITCLFCIPAGLGMSVMSGPIARLIFGARASIPITSRVLVIMGLGAIFASLSTPINSMLQAVGRVDLPVKILAVGLAIKVAINYVFSGIPEINILGAGAGTLVCYLLITILGMILLCRVTKIRPSFLSAFVKPAVSSMVCCAVSYVSQTLLALVIPDKAATCIALAIAVIVYIIALLLCKAISKTDVLMLPKGQKIAKILEKHNWIR